MIELRIGPTAASTPAGRCSVGACARPASRTPVLRISLFGSDHVSRIPLPAHLCSAHARTFPARFLTDARRASIEAALRSRGRGAPDWARTVVVVE